MKLGRIAVLAALVLGWVAVGTPLVAQEGSAPSAAMKDWIDVCIEHLGSDDEDVRRGATLALRVAGPAAHPALEKVAETGSGKVAEVARQILKSVGARGKKPKTDGTGDYFGHITRELELDEAQTEQVTSILESSRQKQSMIAQSIRSGELDKQVGIDRLATLRADVTQQLSEVLDEKQLERYEKLVGGSGKSR